VDLAEWATVEVQVADLQARSLGRTQARVIQRAEHGVVAGRRGPLARAFHPKAKKGKELLHTLRRRWWARHRRVTADMPTGVEDIKGVRESHAEPGLDLGGVPSLQEGEEGLERPDITSPSHRPDAPLDQRTHHRVHVRRGQLPRWLGGQR
jgi:hypothetical protein